MKACTVDWEIFHVKKVIRVKKFRGVEFLLLISELLLHD